MVKRKGIGYIIEAIVAIITLFIFVVGNTGSPQTQDWNSFQKDLAGQDLGYTLKNTGDIEKFLKRQETGSLQTAISTISSGRLDASGTIHNLPLRDLSIGVSAIDSEQYSISIRDLEDSDECTGDLEEIENQSGTTIKRIDSSVASQHNGDVLYFADTDPQISEGHNNGIDYDTMYVDNKTRCQFSSSEGPIYLDEFFRWNTSDGKEAYYDFKNISGDLNEFEIYNATQAVKIQKVLGKRLNGIDTSNSVNTFDLSSDDITVHDIIVLRRNEEIQDINNIQSEADKVRDFLTQGSVLFLANLSRSDIEDSGTTDFMKDTGLKWVELERGSTGDPVFTDSTASGDTETYFSGLEGQKSNLDLPAGGNISSSNEDVWMDENPLLEGSGTYQTEDWNVTSKSMQPEQPSTYSGLVETECITDENSESRSLTQDDLTFTEGIDGSVTYEAVNVEIGDSSTYCQDHDTRALMIDLDGDKDFSEEGEGPFLNGETIVIDGREYIVTILPAEDSRQEGEAVEFVFSENSNIELVNYRTSAEGFNSERIARMAYQDSYNEDERKLIGSTIYWLAEDSREFSSSDTVSGSTTIHGSIDENTYMPYKLSLRWQ